MNDEIMTMLIKLVFMILSVVITSYVLPWIKSKMENEKYSELVAFIGSCVGSAEKLYTPEEWKAKKEYVLNLAESKLASLNIRISAEELNSLIEGMVYQIKESK